MRTYKRLLFLIGSFILGSIACGRIALWFNSFSVFLLSCLLAAAVINAVDGLLFHEKKAKKS